MDKSKLQELTKVDFDKFSSLNSFSYENLFEIINQNGDIEVCKKARQLLYNKITIDFLNNYLADDFFDQNKNESFEIFKFLKDFLENDCEYVELLKNHITSNSTENSIQKAWNFLDTDDLTLGELSEIICDSLNSKVKEEAWDLYIDKVQYSLRNKSDNEDEKAIKSLFSICFGSKNEIFVAESWRLLKQYEFFNETYLELVLGNENPEIIEYAWKHIDTNELKDSELINVVKETANKKVAHEALDLFRNRFK